MQIIKQTEISSLEIAKQTGKKHKNILRDIRSLCDENDVNQLNYEHIYLDKSNRVQKCFKLDRMMFLALVSGYSNKLRFQLAARWDELETKEENRLKKEVISLKPYVSYLRVILVSITQLSTEKIASEYGVLEQELNDRLCELNVQYLEDGKYHLCNNYIDNGYIKNNKWTQSGRAFLYTLLKNDGLKPAVERDVSDSRVSADGCKRIAIDTTKRAKQAHKSYRIEVAKEGKPDFK